MEVEFEWDESKNALNLAKHGIDFRDAIYLFLDDSRIERLDTRHGYGEERWQTIGLSEIGVLFVVYTERKGNRIRLISARPASTREKNWLQRGRLGWRMAGGLG